MEKKTYLTLVFILIAGFLVRFIGLTNTPPSLNWDEVSHGYNAYSILKTGMDQWGVKFPIFNFKAYGDFPTTLNLYFTIPFIAIFGLSEFSIRFPHVILGTLTILSVYYLVYGITKRKDVSLLTAFLVAITPWYLFTSRFVLQSNLSIFLLTTAAAFFVNRAKNKKYLFVSLFLFTLTLFSYHTTRIFSPLLLLGSFMIYKSEIKNKLFYLFAMLFILLTTFILARPEARARSKYLSIFDTGAINKIESNQNKYGRFIVNKLTYAVYVVGTNYISYFSPKYLFLEGGTQYQFSLPGRGLIYPISLPFFYIGLVILLVKALKEKEYRFLLLWLFLSPLPASITNESYTVLRSTTMLPLTEILISIGFWYVADKIQKYKKVFVTFYIIILLFFTESYLYDYFGSYRNSYSWSWQYGYKEAITYASLNYEQYDKILFTKKYGEPHEFVLFFTKYDPNKYVSDINSIKFEQSNWWWVDKFDKYYFLNDWQVKDLKLESGLVLDCSLSSVRCLLITSPGNSPQGWRKIDTINFLDGKEAFEIYANK